MILCNILLYIYIYKTWCNIIFVNFTVSSLVRKLKQQAREQMEERRPNLVSALNQMGDFYMELKWDFQSWGEHYFSLNVP